MSTVAEILGHAMALPPEDRASIAQSLIHSLPGSPRVFATPQELAEELNRRIEETTTGRAPTFDAADTMRRAREAVRQVRR